MQKLSGGGALLMVFNLRSSCCIKACERFLPNIQQANWQGLPLIRRPQERIAKIQGAITEKHLSGSFFTSFLPLFPSLSPFYCLPRSCSAELLCTISGRGEKKKKKSGSGRPIFFPTVHGGRGWRCYRQLDEKQRLMGRQGLVARRSHSELGQQQRLRLVNGLSYWGEKLQMNHRLYAPSWALRSLLTPQPHTSKNTRTYKPYSSAGVSEALPPPISSSLPLSVSSNSVWLPQSDLKGSKPEPHTLLSKRSFHISLFLWHTGCCLLNIVCFLPDLLDFIQVRLFTVPSSTVV